MSETPAAMMQRLAANTRVGYSFEQEFYTSDAVFKADMDRVIGQKWILAGHVSKVPNKGDYFLLEAVAHAGIGGEALHRGGGRFTHRILIRALVGSYSGLSEAVAG